jgi:hypothetical protein
MARELAKEVVVYPSKNVIIEYLYLSVGKKCEGV